MKKILILLMILWAFALVACGGGAEIEIRNYDIIDIINQQPVDEEVFYHNIPVDTNIDEPPHIPDPYIDLVEYEPIFTMQPLPDHIIRLIDGSSFHAEVPFGFDFLTYLTISHRDFEGNLQQGHMIVAEEIGKEVLEIFEEIFHANFPIERMRLIDFYNALDYYSMADNNSVAFNFRTIAGTNILSRHAFGMAIDINPIQNPYIRGDIIWPADGIEYIDRENIRPGMITPGCPVYTAFISRGWIWGGNWTSPRDYHHFERR